MSTPHNQAEIGDIAKIVLMPGDPLRAKLIAETFLQDVVQFNSVRNMYGFTGTYKGKKVSVMGSGMGMPSIGIYSYELYSQYGVEEIIRIGSAGAYVDSLDLYDLVLATSCYSESSYALAQNLDLARIKYPSDELNEKLRKAAGDLGIKLREGCIHSSDVFYADKVALGAWFTNIKRNSCLCVEMESFALFHNAEVLKKKAACLLTISDNLVKDVKISADERQRAFVDMMRVALDAAILD